MLLWLSLSLFVINIYWLHKIQFWFLNATVSTQNHCYIPTRANGILSKLSYYIWQMNFQRMLVLAWWSRTIILSLFEFTSKLNQCKISYNYCISWDLWPYGFLCLVWLVTFFVCCCCFCLGFLFVFSLFVFWFFGLFFCFSGFFYLIWRVFLFVCLFSRYYYHELIISDINLTIHIGLCWTLLRKKEFYVYWALLYLGSQGEELDRKPIERQPHRRKTSLLSTKMSPWFVSLRVTMLSWCC